MDKHKLFHIGIKALITNHQNEILLFQVNLAKHHDHSNGAYWDIPGGRIENNGTIDSTLHRELLEETGISEITSYSFFHASVANIEIPIGDSKVGLALFIYKVTIPENITIKLSDEHLQYQWFSPVEASKLLAIKYPADFTEKISEL